MALRCLSSCCHCGHRLERECARQLKTLQKKVRYIYSLTVIAYCWRYQARSSTPTHNSSSLIAFLRFLCSHLILWPCKQRIKSIPSILSTTFRYFCQQLGQQCHIFCSKYYSKDSLSVSRLRRHDRYIVATTYEIEIRVDENLGEPFGVLRALTLMSLTWQQETEKFCHWN